MPTHVPDQYAVFGNPIAHSKSPLLHAAFARQCGQNLTYRAILAPLDGFEATLTTFIAQGGRGANVTLPFKLEAYYLCTTLSARARSAGAVNTLWFEEDTVFGDNTDGCGLVRDIVDNAAVTLKDKRILLLGAGGAARGALGPLLECQPSALVIANRSIAKARDLQIEFQNHGSFTALPFEELKDQFDVIINATSSSISAHRPLIPDHVYRPGTLAYDMMYADQPTPFMQHAIEQGAIARDGWGMLVEQAAEAFNVWRGVKPDTKELLIKKIQ